MASTNATITVGTITQDDTLGKYKTPINPLDITTDYVVNCHYEADRHIYQLGITSPGGFQGAKVAFVSLATKTLLWVADWTCARATSCPPIPDPTPRDSNWVLLDEAYQPTSITIFDDGVTPIFRISGTYVYGCKNPDEPTIRNVSYPRPAWLDDAFNRTIPTSALEQGLIAITTSTQGSTPGDIGLR